MKMPLLIIIAGLAIGFAVPALAQEKDSVDPEVRQQIEAELMKYDDAFNKHDAVAIADLFAPDAVEVFGWESEGGAVFGQQAIQKRYAVKRRGGYEQPCYQACSGVSNRQRSMRDHRRDCRALD